MRTTGITLILIAVLALIAQVVSEIRCAYALENRYLNHWQLADKSSSIEAKQKHVQRFEAVLEDGYARGDFAAHNAVWLATPNNSFEANKTALHTLTERLAQIQNMSPNTFEYNTAIQQITAQEQGEAHEMIDTFTGCYALANYPLVWGWIGWVFAAAYVIVGVLGILHFAASLD